MEWSTRKEENWEGEFGWGLGPFLSLSPQPPVRPRQAGKDGQPSPDADVVHWSTLPQALESNKRLLRWAVLPAMPPKAKGKKQIAEGTTKGKKQQATLTENETAR